MKRFDVEVSLKETESLGLSENVWRTWDHVNGNDGDLVVEGVFLMPRLTRVHPET